jgi:AraC-like DNA-binding protein
MTLPQISSSKTPSSPFSNLLAEKIASLIKGNPEIETSIPGLKLFSRDYLGEPSTLNFPPSMCLIGQGSKSVLLGDDFYIYDDQHYLLTSVDLPVTAQVLKATPDKPYLGLTLALDLKLINEIILELPSNNLNSNASRLGVIVSNLDIHLLDAFVRLLDLLTVPNDIPALAPLILREIYYRLLTGEQGLRLRQIVSDDNRFGKIIQVINWLKEHFKEKFLVKNLAAKFGMSPSSFYGHFKAITALSPIQYQKKLRLIEAKRLILVEHLRVADAAFQVGYESPSQFSREYARLFGAPPREYLKEELMIG